MSGEEEVTRPSPGDIQSGSQAKTFQALPRSSPGCSGINPVARDRSLERGRRRAHRRRASAWPRRWRSRGSTCPAHSPRGTLQQPSSPPRLLPSPSTRLPFRLYAALAAHPGRLPVLGGPRTGIALGNETSASCANTRAFAAGDGGARDPPRLPDGWGTGASQMMRN